MKQKVFSLPEHPLCAPKMILCYSFYLFVTMLPSASAFGQAQLIRDVNRTEDVFYPEYADLVPANNNLFFSSQRKELWNTNGTTAGTVLYKKFNAISDLLWTGSALYFVGETDGRELWKSTGPGAATARVKNIRPGAEGSDPQHLTDVNGIVYFTANNGVNGTELWKSDGTAAGTVMVKDIFVGETGSEPSQLTNVNGILYFVADDSQHGIELWKSDGTSAGTVLVEDINPGSDGSDPDWLESMGGRVYFTAFHPTSGRELWRSNGTLSGTSMIKNFLAGAASPSITQMTAMGNAVYFMANNALWKSTGTYAGTTLVKQLPSDPGYFGRDLTSINNWLYFTTDYELWVSDGTPAGTLSRMPLVYAGDVHFTAFNGSIYFFDYTFNDEEYMYHHHVMKMAPDGTGITEIWQTPIPWNLDDTIPYFEPGLAQANNILYFYGLPIQGKGQKLMKSDGTTTGTVILKDTYIPTLSSGPNGFVNHKGIVYFRSSLGRYETNQYFSRTDGTSAGTFQLKDIDAIGDITPAGDNVFFQGLMPGGDWQLVRSNGTTAGTTVMKQASFGTWSYSYTVAAIGGTYLFTNGTTELWKTNGTTAGTTLVKTFPRMENMVSDGTRAYMLVEPVPGSFELWKTNGTTAGTLRIQPLVPVSGFSTRYYFFQNSTINGITYFFGTDNYKGHEVWRTDGTAAGTYRIGKIQMPATGQFVPQVRSMTVFQNNFYFSSQNASREFALFKSDGTTAGLVQLITIEAIVQYIPFGDKLLFFPYRGDVDFNTPPVIWSTDGTTAGTVPVKAVPDFSIFAEVDYEIINGVAYFTSSQGVNLWRTDGTDCGTFSVPTGLSQLVPMEAIGNTLILGGFADYVYGNELYRFDVSGAPASPCAAVASAAVAPVEGLAGSESELLTSGPNPFSTDFTLRVNSPEVSEAQLQVYTVNGKLVEANEALPCNTTHQLGQSWTPGFYVIKVRVGDVSVTKKIIKR
jgi:trimeric autotransporter adhesin